MKIYIPMLGFGKAGGHRVLSKFASEWKQLGHDVVFLCPKDYHDIYYPTTASVKYLPTIYSIIPKFLKKKIVRDICGLLSLFTALLAVVKPGDITIANRDLTAFPTRLATLIRRSRGLYYIQAYEPDFYEFKNTLIRKIARAISSSTYSLKLLQIVNAPIYTNFENIKTNHVTPPGIDLLTFYPKNIKEPINKKSITIGCIGRSQIWKGTKDIIDAIQLLRNQGFNISLKVAFHIPQEFTHHEWIDFIQPHGDVNLAAFYRACDFFVAAGKIQYGAFHYPAAESLATGTTLISSPYYPASDSNAYIFNECNPTAIASSILKAINDDDESRRTKTEIGLNDVSNLSWNRAAEIFLEHLKSV